MLRIKQVKLGGVQRCLRDVTRWCNPRSVSASLCLHHKECGRSALRKKHTWGDPTHTDCLEETGDMYLWTHTHITPLTEHWNFSSYPESRATHTILTQWKIINEWKKKKKVTTAIVVQFHFDFNVTQLHLVNSGTLICILAEKIPCFIFFFLCAGGPTANKTSMVFWKIESESLWRLSTLVCTLLCLSAKIKSAWSNGTTWTPQVCKHHECEHKRTEAFMTAILSPEHKQGCWMEHNHPTNLNEKWKKEWINEWMQSFP